MAMDHLQPIAGMAAQWTQKHLTPENLEWLRSLPSGPIQLPQLPDVQFVHVSPMDEDEYVVTARDALEPLLLSSVPLTFFGHSHVQGDFSPNSIHAGHV